MPNPPPTAESGLHVPLGKFTLVPTFNSSTSPVTLTLANNAPLSNTALSALRTTLVASKTLAIERNALCEANRRNVVERQANDKKVFDEGARLKEQERKRRREEDERKDRERAERSERDRVEKEREDLLAKRKQDEIYESARLREEERKRVADEHERAAAVRRAREAKEKSKVEQVLAIVRANQEQSTRASSTASSPMAVRASEDVSMVDQFKQHSTPIPLSTQLLPSPPIPPIPPPSVDNLHNPSTTVPSISTVTIGSSPEPEDDMGQPKPPLRQKSHDKKKRKRDQIADSDASESDNSGGRDHQAQLEENAPMTLVFSADQPLLPKIRKLDDSTFPNTASASPATSLPLDSPTKPSTIAPSLPKDPSAGLTHVQRKLKEEKFIKHSIPTRQPAAGTATAFYLPYHSLVPPKPISIPPIPTPKKQSEVAEDFSKAKPGTQIAHHTFHTWAEAYLRPFGEDDLAFLAPKPEDITPYIIPPLGKHYLDRWEEDDADGPFASTSYLSPLEPPPLVRIKPDALTEDALGMENIYMGPLSERLVAALAFVEGGEEGDDEEDGVVKDSSVDEVLLPRPKGAVIDAVDLEERIKRELRFIGILPEDDVNWSTREDDEVSSALRSCQRLLHHQNALNEARKAVLSSIVQDRMAYQDYETTRDAQERVIENGWTKRQRAGKKKGKGKERDKVVVDNSKAPVSLALLGAIDKRHKLVRQFIPFFEEEEDKGRYAGIPEESVFSGIDVEEDEEGELIGGREIVVT